MAESKKPLEPGETQLAVKGEVIPPIPELIVCGLVHKDGSMTISFDVPVKPTIEGQLPRLTDGKEPFDMFDNVLDSHDFNDDGKEPEE